MRLISRVSTFLNFKSVPICAFGWNAGDQQSWGSRRQGDSTELSTHLQKSNSKLFQSLFHQKEINKMVKGKAEYFQSKSHSQWSHHRKCISQQSWAIFSTVFSGQRFRHQSQIQWEWLVPLERGPSRERRGISPGNYVYICNAFVCLFVKKVPISTWFLHQWHLLSATLEVESRPARIENTGELLQLVLSILVSPVCPLLAGLWIVWRLY